MTTDTMQNADDTPKIQVHATSKTEDSQVGLSTLSEQYMFQN